MIRATSSITAQTAATGSLRRSLALTLLGLLQRPRGSARFASGRAADTDRVRAAGYT
jgi:hypothetical protein